MSTFKEIRGQLIRKYTTDPTTPLEGQIWYNSTSGTLKGYGEGVMSTWASGGTYPTPVTNIQSAGTSTAGLAFGGVDTYTPSPNTSSLTSSYNGTSWTALAAPANLDTAINWGCGCGTETSALCFSGNGPTPPAAGSIASQSWDGSTWTATNNMNTYRMAPAGAGTQGAALCAGGYIPPASPASSNAAEEFDGTNWSTVNPINTTRGLVVGGGIQTAAVIYGGYDWGGPGARNNTEEYDGTNWTSVNNLPAASEGFGGSGTQTATIAWCPTYAALYDGTNWTNTTSMTSARGGTTKQIGSGNIGVALGGDAGPGLVDQTEEYTLVGVTTLTVTTS